MLPNKHLEKQDLSIIFVANYCCLQPNKNKIGKILFYAYF